MVILELSNAFRRHLSIRPEVDLPNLDGLVVAGTDESPQTRIERQSANEKVMAGKSRQAFALGGRPNLNLSVVGTGDYVVTLNNSDVSSVSELSSCCPPETLHKQDRGRDLRKCAAAPEYASPKGSSSRRHSR